MIFGTSGLRDFRDFLSVTRRVFRFSHTFCVLLRRLSTRKSFVLASKNRDFVVKKGLLLRALDSCLQAKSLTISEMMTFYYFTFLLFYFFTFFRFLNT